MVRFKLSDCFAVLGRRGCGKSFLCKKIQTVFPKTVVIDTLREYTDGERVSDFGDFCDLLLEYKKTRKKKFRIIFQFNPDIPDAELIFDQILKICYKAGNLLLVIEEVQIYSSPHFLPLWLKNCLLTGRHQNLSLIFTTQRPGELNKTILSQCSHIFAGQMHERNDIKYISSFLGLEAEKLTNLEPRKFIYWQPGQAPVVVKNTLTN